MASRYGNASLRPRDFGQGSAPSATTIKRPLGTVFAVARQRESSPQGTSSRLVFESLEPRVLLSGETLVPHLDGSLDLQGGVDRYRTPVADDVHVAFDAITDAPAMRWSVNGARDSDASDRGGYLAYALGLVPGTRLGLRANNPTFALGTDANDLLPEGSAGANYSVTLSHAEGARRIVFSLADDAGLLTASGIIAGPDLPEGSTLTTDFSVAGEVHIEITSAVPLGGETLDLLHLQTQLPNITQTHAQLALEVRNAAIDGASMPLRTDDGLAVATRLFPTRHHHSTEREQQRVLVAVNNDASIVSHGGEAAVTQQVQLLRAEIGGTLKVSVGLGNIGFKSPYALIIVYPEDKLELLGVRNEGLGQDFSMVARELQPGVLRIDITWLGLSAVTRDASLPLEFRVKEGATGLLNVDLHWYTVDANGLLLRAGSEAAESGPGISFDQVSMASRIKFDSAPLDVLGALNEGALNAQGGWLKAWLSGQTGEPVRPGDWKLRLPT